MLPPNAIDLTKLGEDQLLEHLGKADWVIALPEGLPNVTITTQWRETLQAHSGKQFARWVMEGIDRVLTHNADTPGDHSGSLRNIRVDSLMLLIRHNSLSDWAKHEYTGHSEATFVSGMRLAWLRYDEEIRDYLETRVTEYVRVHCMNFWKIEEEKLFEDERWDLSDIPIIISLLAYALQEDSLQLSTSDAWKWFENDIHAENEAKRKKAEQYRAMQEQVKQFWELHFPYLLGMRIEMSLFREMQFEKRISEVLADADPAMVRMMAQVHIPGHYSNKVREHIQHIVRRANE